MLRPLVPGPAAVTSLVEPASGVAATSTPIFRASWASGRYGPDGWRYELPQLALIPVAAVLGAMALTGRTSDRTPATLPTSTAPPVHTGQPADTDRPASSASHPAHTGQTPMKPGR